jgi:hypothetical protein
MGVDRPAGAPVIWWHTRRRVTLAVAVALTVIAAAVALFATGRTTEGALALSWVVLTSVLQLRPWLYATFASARLLLRVLSLVLLLVPVLVIDPAEPASRRVWLSVGLGIACGLAFVASHARDTRLLLEPSLLALQPAMSPAGAAGRLAFVLAVVPLEELYYRALVIDALRPGIGAWAVVVSVAAFVYANWAGSWGPSSSRKRLLSEVGLAAATGVTYYATGSVVGTIVMHYLYNLPQLAVPPLSLWVHRAGTDRQPHRELVS